MFDSIGSALDTASQMLAGGASAPGAGGPSTPAKYIKGTDLEKPDPGVGDSTAPNLDNVRDKPEQTEFIHFGFVHTSYTSVFSHPSYKDNEEIKDLGEKAKPRAIQFRSALEREAILLAGFMQSTQTVLQEREDDKGALGDAMSALGSLAGIGGGGAGVSGPADVNAFIQKVKSAAGALNATPIEYKTIHKTGMDFHQARNDYRAFLKKVVDEKPKADPAGGLMGKLPGIGGIGGPVGEIIAVAQGIAFKPMDIRVKFFVKVAAQQEKQVETVCNAMTLSALTPAYTPFLPVWFAKDRAKWDAPASPVKKAEDGNLLAPVINPVAGAFEDARKAAAGGVNAVKDFFENPKTDAPGEPFLTQAFGLPPRPGQLSEPFPMELGALALVAFEEALGTKIPDFLESIVDVIMGIMLDMTHGALQATLHRDPSKPILGDDLFNSARHRMLQRLIDLALDKVSFLKSAKDFQLKGPMGINLKPSDLADKGIAKLEEMVNEKIGTYLNAPLKIAMGTFADQLELARQQGLKEKCHTMECYLGRLPWMQASLFCNIFFPFWDALMDILGDVMGDVLGGPLKAIGKAAKAAKGMADSARDALAQANAVKKKLEADKDELSKGISAQDVIEGKTGVGKGYGKAMDSKADAINGPSIAQGKFDFPLQGRKQDGEGKKIEDPEYGEVQPNEQWDKADNPPRPRDDAASPAAA